jgi:hypothetical protein
MSCDCDDWQEHAWQAARLEELERKESQRRMADLSDRLGKMTPNETKLFLQVGLVLVAVAGVFALLSDD